jgi:hypothetical protein|tara:strand:- start:254 stop:436 length:183 start_codon:yes stop_codon:yes gene_type:complete
VDVSDKEIARLFFITKGHLVQMKTMAECYDGYFRRMWNNHEATYREEGFEEAWRKYKNDI